MRQGKRFWKRKNKSGESEEPQRMKGERCVEREEIPESRERRENTIRKERIGGEKRRKVGVKMRNP